MHIFLLDSLLGGCMKPFILISPNFDKPSLKYSLSEFYTKAILKSGGIPIITPFENIENIEEIIDKADGVLLSGGGDIHPKFFNEEISEKSTYVNTFRDEFEIKLVKEAIKRDMPILCICRGIQVLNVVLGGNVYEHIDYHFDKNNDNLSHDIDIVENSYFEKLFNKRNFIVNSIHHQSVKDYQNDVEVIAYCNNIIEAIKVKNKRFVVGVQYHPERIYENEESKILFDEFIRVCNER